MTYIRAKSQGQVYILAKDLADKVLGEGYEVLEELMGKDLEHIEYGN